MFYLSSCHLEVDFVSLKKKKKSYVFIFANFSFWKVIIFFSTSLGCGLSSLNFRFHGYLVGLCQISQ